jgi:hypothetical protein
MSLRMTAVASCLGALVWLAVGPACAREEDGEDGGAMLVQLPEELARDELRHDKTAAVRTPAEPEDRSTAILPPVSFQGEATRETPSALPPAAPAPVATRVPPEMLALDGTVAARVNELRDCRREIAINRRVSPGDVAAGRLLLRWTIQPGGDVSDAEVVAEQRTDPDVLSCARRMMSGWVFVRAPGGEPLRIEQRLAFQ